MQTYEFEGKTTDEAIEHASRQLNLSKEDMEIEIMEPGSAGIFGLVGGRKAKIKVTINTKETVPDDKATINTTETVSDDKVTINTKETVSDDNEDVIDAAKRSLESILSLIPMEGTSVSAEHSDGTVLLNIQGDKSGLLIGRKGRTLDALQFIVNKIVNKSLERRSQVVVDSENYRKRRQEALIQMALNMGSKAKKIRKPVSTNLLNPQERRTIHMALKEDQNLDTKSRGEGLLKKVIIIPRKQSH